MANENVLLEAAKLCWRDFATAIAGVPLDQLAEQFAQAARARVPVIVLKVGCPTLSASDAHVPISENT